MVELHSHCCYSFLDGASHPHELVEQAVAYGYKAVALTDHNGLYGSMEFTQSAHAAGLQAITGAEITLDNEAHLTLLAETDDGYSNLCCLLSMAHREGERLSPRLPRTALAEHARGLIALSGCPQGEVPRLLDAGKVAEAERVAAEYREWFGAENTFLEVQHNLVQGDTARLKAVAALGRRLKIPLAATGNTHYHVEERHRLQDVMVAIRHGMSLHEAQRYRRRNSQFALPEPEVFRARFAAVPEALETIETIAKRCESFDLTRDLGYQFPDFARESSDTEGKLSADETLAQYCWEALEVKYAPPHHAHRAEAEQWLKNELRLVALHGLGGFFLVYRDLLQMSKEVARDLRGGKARGKFALPPGRGRGSAVSSIICYLIGLSSVDPVKSKLFPGRFLNESLASVPDIDIDFPRDIREELIRRVHKHYGDDHVAMVCIFPTYRFRGAVREVGKALALPPAELDRLAKVGDAHGQVGEQLPRLSEFHTLTENPLWKHLTELSEQLWGMPRHLSQHVGGVVISSRPLVEIVPIEHSAMEGRQVCQWDKDSVDIARMIKVDFLALGMLSAVEECLDLIEANDKPALDLSRVPYDDAVLYNRICRGETVGAFQIESRAQIGMLVRTRPRTIEDLAIQVAIVRPGPVVANSVNPYVREREKQRTRRNYKPTYDHPLLEKTLEDTLGIIIFQDQVMESCKALAGFTDGEADQLRRAMSRKRSRENMERFRTRFIDGAAGKGVDPETALKVFEKVVAFSEFGFPKSHSAAFAVLAYQSMWLLHYYPAEFVTALLNAQPMGFYPPDTLIKDAQRRGIRFRVPDLNRSQLLSTVAGETVQLGLNTLKGVGEAKGEAILAERAAGGPFVSLPDFLRRTRVPDRVAESLILVGAMAEFGLNPRELLWQLGLLSFQRGEQFMTRTEGGLVPAARQLALDVPVEQDQVDLPPAGRWERLAHDYRLMALSVADHPVGLLRPLLRSRVVSIGDLRRCRDKARVDVAGLVTTRQRPQTAKGILFLLLEDETGMLNVVCRKELWEAQRELFRTEPLLIVRGVLEQKDRRLNLVAEEAWPLSDSLPDPVKESASRRMHEALAAFQAPPSHNYR